MGSKLSVLFYARGDGLPEYYGGVVEEAEIRRSDIESGRWEHADDERGGV